MSSIGSYYGNPIRWPISPAEPDLSYYIQSADPIVVQSIQDSALAWSNIETSYVNLTQTGVSTSANIVIVVDNDLGNPYAGGYASYSYSGNGEITSCTVHLLASQVSLGYDLFQPLALHEMGHCLGLIHSVSAGAAMSYRGGGANPTDDDAFALTLLYPASGSSLPPSCGTIHTSPTNTGNTPQDMIGFALPWILVAILYRTIIGRERVQPSVLES